MPHEVQTLAGNASIKREMTCYAGIRESMIDRARLGSIAAFDNGLVARLTIRAGPIYLQSETEACVGQLSGKRMAK